MPDLLDKALEIVYTVIIKPDTRKEARTMKTNRKPTPRFTGICHTDSRSIAEAYGSNKDTVTRKTLAGALCFNETTFSILTTMPGKPASVEHFIITDPTTGSYTLTN